MEIWHTIIQSILCESLCCLGRRLARFWNGSGERGRDERLSVLFDVDGRSDCSQRTDPALRPRLLIRQAYKYKHTQY